MLVTVFRRVSNGIVLDVFTTFIKFAMTFFDLYANSINTFVFSVDVQAANNHFFT